MRNTSGAPWGSDAVWDLGRASVCYRQTAFTKGLRINRPDLLRLGRWLWHAQPRPRPLVEMRFEPEGHPQPAQLLFLFVAMVFSYQQTARTNGFLTSWVRPRRGPFLILNLFGRLLWQAHPRPRPPVLTRFAP